MRARNEKPQFSLPDSYLSRLRVEDLDEDLAKQKASLQKLEQEVDQAVGQKQAAKKVHWFVTSLYKRACGRDLFLCDYIVKRLGHRRRVNVHRRNVIEQVFRALCLYHNLLTGLLDKSCLTLLSDQMDITTYGQKRYGDFNAAHLNSLPPEQRQILQAQIDKDANTGKKKSISRISRALSMLQDWGLVLVHHKTDAVTGKYLGAVIQVTEAFYDLLDVDEETKLKARMDRVRRMIERYELPEDFDLEQLQDYTQDRIEELQRQRADFALGQRMQKRLKRLSKVEMRQAAQRSVVAEYTPHELECMGDYRFSQLVRERTAELWQQRNNAEAMLEAERRQLYH